MCQFEGVGVVITRLGGGSIMRSTLSWVRWARCSFLAWGPAVMAYALAATAGAATYYVAPGGSDTSPYTNWPAAAHSISSAVSLAEHADEVWVSNGTYYITAFIKITNGITLSSVNGAGVTIVDAQATTRCFRVAHTGAVVRGFTMTNGAIVGSGAGVFLANGVVEDCIITGCKMQKSDGYGGGVHLGGPVTLRRCVITGNVAMTASYGSGGGVSFNDVSGLAVVEDCIIVNNRAYYQGGGVQMWVGGILRDCLVAGNYCMSYGAGVYVYSSPNVIENCTIVSNYCSYVGGGMRVNGSVTTRNTIVYFNRAVSAGDNVDNGPNGYFYHCCTKPTNDILGLVGCITNDPMFVDRSAGDWHLAYGSPCIDTGTNLSATVTNDLDGNARPLDGDYNTTTEFDMGCYEYNPLVSDTDGDTMCDGYELQYGLNPIDPADGDQHADADGISNADECQADTDPTDADSYLGFRKIEYGGPAMIVTFTGGTGAWRIIDSSYDLTNWFFSSSLEPPTDVTNEIGFSPSAPKRFLRMRAHR